MKPFCHSLLPTSTTTVEAGTVVLGLLTFAERHAADDAAAGRFMDEGAAFGTTGFLACAAAAFLDAAGFGAAFIFFIAAT